MKLTILQENLAQGISIVSRAVSPRSTIPVLANILAMTEDGRLRLSATNLELGITCWIGAKIEQEGSTTIPARTFADLVSILPKDRVELDLTEKTQSLRVKCGNSDAKIKCIDAQEFPPMSDLAASDGIQMKVSDLKEIIRQVVFAASTDEARPVLSGVLVEIDSDQITFAAADGFRLSIRSLKLSSPVVQPASVIIPARALSELARVVSDGDQTMIMFLPPERGQVIFRTEDVELISQLIEGNFPDFRQIIPKDYETRSVMSTSELLKACKQAEIFARENSHIARINIVQGNDVQPGTVEIFAQSDETGQNETVVEAKVEGSDLSIAFNVRFLCDVLDAIRTPHVTLETSTSTNPGIIRPYDNETDFTHVIMPMHL